MLTLWKSDMNNFYITEASIHYVASLLDNTAEKIPSRKHLDVLAEFRDLSNKLLETLEKPTRINVIRHHINPDA